MSANIKPVWIISCRFDSCFIVGPGIAISLLILLFSKQIQTVSEMPPWLWLVLIVGIDAGHVYATLFRTYLVKSELKRHHALLSLAPLLVWLGGCLLYSIADPLFWRVLAYLAVYHFVRQQYGFMMIYGRHEHNTTPIFRGLDKTAIYAATLFPLIYWHCHNRRFNWFIEGDFLLLNSSWLWQSAALIYGVIICAYLLKEWQLWRKTKTINLPRNLLLLGTGLSWFVGIVAFNNDLIFTSTNIIAHGIPYYALIWAYGYKQNHRESPDRIYLFAAISKVFQYRYVPVYILILFALACFEEGLWDGLIWREHAEVFAFFNFLPALTSSKTLTWLVPLLATPQMTHYLLDAFIWRMHSSEDNWQAVLLPGTEQLPIK